MAQKITTWLLRCIVLSLGFGQLLRFEYLGATFFLHELLIVILIAFNLRDVTKIFKNSTLKIFFAGLGLSWLNALRLYDLGDLLIPSLYTARILAYLSVYQLVTHTRSKIDSIYFAVAGLVTIAIGLMQYLFMPDMRIFQYLGWDDHLSRLTLPHFDPTFTGAMLTIFMLIYISKWSSKKYLGTLSYLVAIALTYSRSIWLTLLATMSLQSRKFLLIAISCLLLAIAVLPRSVGEGTNLLRIYSITSRLDADLEYIKTYKWDLVIGRGLNTLVLDKNSDNLIPQHATGPNNSYLYLLTTTGILGLLGWLKFLKHLYKTSIYKSVVIFIAVASLFNNIMFYPFTLIILLMIGTW